MKEAKRQEFDKELLRTYREYPDIPAALRRLAARLANGDHGDIGHCVIVLASPDNDKVKFLYDYGAAPDRKMAAALCSEAANKLRGN